MIQGNFFRSGESKLHTVRLQYINGELFIYKLSSNELLKNSSIKDAKISGRIGNTARNITFDDNSRFETLDNDAIDTLIKENVVHSSQLIHWLETNYSMIAVMLFSTIFITWAMIQYGIPASAKWAAYKVPPTWYAESGNTTLKYLDEAILSPSELPEERQQRLQHYFLSSLSKNDSPIPIQVSFRHSEFMGPNAFALPSGDIVFTDQLVNLACDDRELLAIFGHEVGHIKERHMARRVLQSSVIAIAAAITFGDSSSMGELIAAIPTFLLEMGYSRDFEREADDYALEYMHTRNIELGFFTSIMNRIEAQYDELNSGNESKFENYFVTHPSTTERTEKFGNAVAISNCQNRTAIND